MTDTPKRIWAWECDPAWKTAWDVDDAEAPPHAKQYHRADLSADLVRAAWEAAALSAYSNEIYPKFWREMSEVPFTE